MFDFNQQIIDEFRANQGRVGGMFDGARLVLLTTTGARTGKRHTNPVGYLPDLGGRILVIASAGGAPKHPDWYHNLRASPRVTVETGVFTFEADAVVLEADERDRIWARAVESDPGWAEYQAKTDRVIPVIALNPVSGSLPDLPEGDALKLIHDAFRRDLALVRSEVAASGPSLGAQLRINCLTLCGGLHHHHDAESGELFPYLRDRYPELDAVLDRLYDQHATLAGLLDDLQKLLSTGATDPEMLLGQVDRLVDGIEAHLAYEEEQLLAILNALPSRGDDHLTVTHIPAAGEHRAVAMASGAPQLPGDADLTGALAHTGGVRGQWVNASKRAAADAGVTLYVHGGGFEHADPEMERLMAYHLSTATGRPVFAVDHRLAPEHPYPAALDDVATVFRSLLDQGVPAGDIVLFGESSGGTLVLSALLALKPTGTPQPGAAIAVSPMTDLTLSGRSIDTNDGQDVLSRPVLEHIASQYLDGSRADQAPQSPLHGDPGGLTALLLVAGSREVLLDDARRFAAAASAAGVDVTFDIYDGMTHAFHTSALSNTPAPAATTFLRRLAEWTNGGPAR